MPVADTTRARGYLPDCQWRSRSRDGRIEDPVQQVMEDKPVTVDKFKYQLAFNVILHIDVFTDNDYTKEEMKMHYETREIMHTEITVSVHHPYAGVAGALRSCMGRNKTTA